MIVSVQAQAQEAKQLPPAQTPLIDRKSVQTEQPPAGGIDLQHDHNTPAAAPGLTPSQALLLPTQQGSTTQTHSTTRQTQGINSTTQQVNATSTQYKPGKQKATTTIYEDNTGRKSSATSIQIGGK